MLTIIGTVMVDQVVVIKSTTLLKESAYGPESIASILVAAMGIPRDLLHTQCAVDLLCTGVSS